MSKQRHIRTGRWSLLTAALALAFSGATAAMEPVTIIDQGVFAAGGTVITARGTYDPLHPQTAGQTLHGDHATIHYQVPQNPRQYPLFFLHGYGQHTRTWDSTPDGRDGYRNIFLADGYPVYLINQPRRADAGRATITHTINATPDDQFWFGQFRMGLWPDFYKGSAFPQDEASLDQFFRQITPDTAPFDLAVNTKAIVAAFDRVGDNIFVTHSQGCNVGWQVGMNSDHLKALVAYEPGMGFPFPEGEVPEPKDNNGFFGANTPTTVPLEQFMKLTRYPIVIFYGDFIPEQASDNPYQDFWRVAVEMAREFAACINRHGGDAQVIELPDMGIKGNSHFLFAEKNNEQVAKVLQDWLHYKNLDGRAQ